MSSGLPLSQLQKKARQWKQCSLDFSKPSSVFKEVCDAGNEVVY